ncbi:Hypothetical protein POVR2_LOCUS226 [uncultured virus]|nr:Hypothetical protein POVR2_LOCUS226 [uncultured virus]
MNQAPRPEDMKLNPGKFKEVIKKLQEDRNLAVSVHDLYKNNHQIQRNANNIAKGVQQQKMGVGGDISLNRAKKMQQQSVLAKQQYLQDLASKGQTACVVIPQKGSPNNVTSITFLPADMEDEKWQLQPAIIAGLPFVAICNSTIYSGTNKLASRLLGMDAYGPIIFMLLNDNHEPEDIKVAKFKSLIA